MSTINSSKGGNDNKTALRNFLKKSLNQYYNGFQMKMVNPSELYPKDIIKVVNSDGQSIVNIKANNQFRNLSNVVVNAITTVSGDGFNIQRTGNNQVSLSLNGYVYNGNKNSRGFGENLNITNPNEFVVGAFNKSSNNTVFSVGNGNNENRSNAIEVKKDGSIFVQGLENSIQTTIKNIEEKAGSFTVKEVNTGSGATLSIELEPNTYKTVYIEEGKGISTINVSLNRTKETSKYLNEYKLQIVNNLKTDIVFNYVKSSQDDASLYWKSSPGELTTLLKLLAYEITIKTSGLCNAYYETFDITSLEDNFEVKVNFGPGTYVGSQTWTTVSVPGNTITLPLSNEITPPTGKVFELYVSGDVEIKQAGIYSYQIDSMPAKNVNITTDYKIDAIRDPLFIFDNTDLCSYRELYSLNDIRNLSGKRYLTYLNTLDDSDTLSSAKYTIKIEDTRLLNEIKNYGWSTDKYTLLETLNPLRIFTPGILYNDRILVIDEITILNDKFKIYDDSLGNTYKFNFGSNGLKIWEEFYDKDKFLLDNTDIFNCNMYRINDIYNTLYDTSIEYWVDPYLQENLELVSIFQKTGIELFYTHNYKLDNAHMGFNGLVMDFSKFEETIKTPYYIHIKFHALSGGETSPYVEKLLYIRPVNYEHITKFVYKSYISMNELAPLVIEHKGDILVWNGESVSGFNVKDQTDLDSPIWCEAKDNIHYIHYPASFILDSRFLSIRYGYAIKALLNNNSVQKGEGGWVNEPPKWRDSELYFDNDMLLNIQYTECGLKEIDNIISDTILNASTLILNSPYGSGKPDLYFINEDFESNIFGADIARNTDDKGNLYSMLLLLDPTYAPIDKNGRLLFLHNDYVNGTTVNRDLLNMYIIKSVIDPYIKTLDLTTIDYYRSKLPDVHFLDSEKLLPVFGKKPGELLKYLPREFNQRFVPFEYIKDDKDNIISTYFETAYLYNFINQEKVYDPNTWKLLLNLTGKNEYELGLGTLFTDLLGHSAIDVELAFRQKENYPLPYKFNPIRFVSINKGSNYEDIYGINIHGEVTNTGKWDIPKLNPGNLIIYYSKYLDNLFTNNDAILDTITYGGNPNNCYVFNVTTFGGDVIEFDNKKNGRDKSKTIIFKPLNIFAKFPGKPKEEDRYEQCIAVYWGDGKLIKHNDVYTIKVTDPITKNSYVYSVIPISIYKESPQWYPN